MKTGIAICTFNRLETLKQTIFRIRSHTKTDCELIVIDDGSSDGTLQEIEKSDVKILSPRNRGIAWNKNRALYYLKNFAKCDAIIVIEDDTFPLEDGWEGNWIEAILRWGHIGLAARFWGKGPIHDGDGTPQRPFKSVHVSAQCSGFSAESIDHAGYMDSRFRGWGMEHVEHTDRLIRAGFGGEPVSPLNRNVYYLIDSNLEVLFREESVGLASHEKQQLIAKSIETCIELRKEKLKRDPWSNDEEMVIFLSEFNGLRNRPLYFHIKNDEDQFLGYEPESGSLLFLRASEIFNNHRLRQVICHYDGKWLKLLTLVNGAASYLTPSVLSFEQTARTDEADDLLFDVILDQKSGMFLKHNGNFMTCEKAKGRIVSITRKEASDWERFYFSHFENNALNTAQ